MESSDMNYDHKSDYDEHEAHKRSIKKWTDEEVCIIIPLHACSAIVLVMVSYIFIIFTHHLLSSI